MEDIDAIARGLSIAAKKLPHESKLYYRQISGLHAAVRKVYDNYKGRVTVAQALSVIRTRLQEHATLLKEVCRKGSRNPMGNPEKLGHRSAATLQYVGEAAKNASYARYRR